MRYPDSWEYTLELKPESFLASSMLSEQELKYIPFGSGRRGCPAANLAYILIGSAVGTMVQCFDWKTKGDRVNMEEAAGGMNLTMAHPLNCTPVGGSLNPQTLRILILTFHLDDIMMKIVEPVLRDIKALRMQVLT
ncbi:hypothetical protein YC2023_067200 [Brassica napus]